MIFLCRGHEDCPGSDAQCNLAHDNCQWCNNTDIDIGQCNPGSSFFVIIIGLIF